MRKIADDMRDERSKHLMHQIADDYERLAKRVEGRAKTQIVVHLTELNADTIKTSSRSCDAAPGRASRQNVCPAPHEEHNQD